METHPPTIRSNPFPAHTFALDQEFAALLRKNHLLAAQKPYILTDWEKIDEKFSLRNNPPGEINQEKTVTSWSR